MRQESIQICKGTINIPLQDARDCQPECSLDSDSEGRKQCSTRVQKALYSELYKIVRGFCPPLTLISKIPSQQALKHIWAHGRTPTFRLFAQERSSRGESLTMLRRLQVIMALTQSFSNRKKNIVEVVVKIGVHRQS